MPASPPRARARCRLPCGGLDAAPPGGEAPSPSPRAGPREPGSPALPRRPPHVEIRARSGFREAACALAPAAEGPWGFRLPRSPRPGALRGSEPVGARGGADGEAGRGARGGGVARAAGTREAAGPGYARGRWKAPRSSFPGPWPRHELLLSPQIPARGAAWLAPRSGEPKAASHPRQQGFLRACALEKSKSQPASLSSGYLPAEGWRLGRRFL